MTAHGFAARWAPDRIRLTGLLRESPASAGLFYFVARVQAPSGGSGPTVHAPPRRDVGYGRRPQWPGRPPPVEGPADSAKTRETATERERMRLRQLGVTLVLGLVALLASAVAPVAAGAATNPST